VLSEGQPGGAIEVPQGGHPIILLAGRQTVGGYPKIGVVGQRSLSDLGQALPGTEITFEPLSIAELSADTGRWRAVLDNPSSVTELI
jgi:antagonist of KipI